MMAYLDYLHDARAGVNRMVNFICPTCARLGRRPDTKSLTDNDPNSLIRYTSASLMMIKAADRKSTSAPLLDLLSDREDEDAPLVMLSLHPDVFIPASCC